MRQRGAHPLAELRVRVRVRVRVRGRVRVRVRGRGRGRVRVGSRVPILSRSSCSGAGWSPG